MIKLCLNLNNAISVKGHGFIIWKNDNLRDIMRLVWAIFNF